MATIATLTWNQYAVLVFDKYNERYEGTYPNLKYKADVRCRFEARNGGWFSIYATNTFKLGGLSKTHTLNYTNATVTSWYSVGTINESMGCNRTKSWSWGCSCSGFPNISGTAKTSSPTIALPKFTFDILEGSTTRNSIKVTGKLTSNPHGLYVLRLYNPKSLNWWTNRLNGDATFNGLSANTQYTFRPEVWMADLSGSRIIGHTDYSETTLENYAIPTITGISISVVSQDGYDAVTFTVNTTDNGHVTDSLWSGTISPGEEVSISGRTYGAVALDQNSTFTVTCKIKDALGRYSNPYSVTFNTTITDREVWCFVNGTWKRGVSLSLNGNTYDRAEIWVFTGSEWKPAIPYS